MSARPSSAPASGAPRAALACASLVAAVLAGCASGPGGAPSRGPGADRDGPEPNPPADLARVPDAEPQVEPIRKGGPNKPYEVAGQTYVPQTADARVLESGLASWYGRKFHGRRTASGEVYNMYSMTAAHKTLPIPSYARVRNPANGREVVVRVNDRGPFVAGRIVDLSYTAALKLDLLRGVGKVELERLTFDDIRTGAWRRDGPATVLAAAEPVAQTTPGLAPAFEAAPLAAAAPVGDAPPGAVLPSVEPTPAAPPPAAATPAPAPSPAGDAATTPPAADGPDATAHTAPARGFWVQLGAFREREGAVDFQRRVTSTADWLAPLLAVFSETSMFRLQAGPYPTRAEAHGVARRVRDALKLVPMVIERR